MMKFYILCACLLLVCGVSAQNNDNSIELVNDQNYSNARAKGIYPTATNLALQGEKANGDGNPCNAMVIASTYCDGPGVYPHDNTGANTTFAPGTFNSASCGDNNEHQIFFRFIATTNSVDITVNRGTMGAAGRNCEITILYTSPNQNNCTHLYNFYQASCPAFGTPVSFQNVLTVGNTYYIAIDHTGPANRAGTFGLCLDPWNWVPPIGGGQTCGTAVDINFNGGLPFNDSGKNPSAAPDNWEYVCQDATGSGGYRTGDIWYKYTSLGDEYISVELSNITWAGASGYDIVYFSTVDGCPANKAHPPGFSNNCYFTGTFSHGAAIGGPSLIGGFNGINCRGMYLANPGDYYFVIDSDGSHGCPPPSPCPRQITNFEISIQSLAAAANDSCSNPNVVGAAPSSGNNSGCNYSFGGDDPINSQICALSLENTAWFQFTTNPATSDVDITFSNVTGDVQWGVMTGPCGGPYTSAGTNTSNPGANGTIQEANAAGTGTTGIGASSANDPCWRDDSDHTINIAGLTPNTTYWLVVDGNAGTYSSFDITITGILLSADFINLKGVHTAKGNSLTWFVSNEEKMNAYRVERSEENGDFKTIGVVKANSPNSTIAKYGFLDEDISAHHNYYRVVAVDNAGVESVSKLIVIDNNKFQELEIINVTPLPFKNSLDITYASANSEIINLKVYNMNGQVVGNQELTPALGVNQAHVDFSSLSKGNYLLFLTNGEGERAYQKVIKE